MAAADDEGKGGQQQRQTTTACKIRWQTTTRKDKRGRGERAETVEW
jgi:hypothetical protein